MMNTTCVASTNADSALDGYDQENDILGAQTDFEGNPKRRHKIKREVSPLIAGNWMVLDEGTASVENDHLEDGPDYSTDMGSLHWEEFKHPSIAGHNLNARIQGDENKIIVTKGLVDSFSAFGIDDCSSNVHAQADEDGNLVMEK
ncbi:hypothetical protein DID88_008397 [Monilinia fructigena]|uniref:Uncharacterized protein n=1 Tax=Monilinia fructigena TaxID=38457 RepID=A0A395J682_9HELO|nr:hypothetical protein DID88_008397 [Monilinia fructigena]